MWLVCEITIQTICNKTPQKTHMSHMFKKTKFLSNYFLKTNCTEQLSTSMFLYIYPLSHQTAMPQHLYSVLKTCQRAVGSPQNMPKISNLPVKACTQRPQSTPTASTRLMQSLYFFSRPSSTFKACWRWCCCSSVPVPISAL